jgi:hypothetical protein
MVGGFMNMLLNSTHYTPPHFLYDLICLIWYLVLKKSIEIVKPKL